MRKRSREEKEERSPSLNEYYQHENKVTTWTKSILQNHFNRFHPYPFLPPSLSLSLWGDWGYTSIYALQIPPTYPHPPRKPHTHTAYREQIHSDTQIHTCRQKTRSRSSLTKAILRLRRNFLMCFHWRFGYLLYVFPREVVADSWIPADEGKWGKTACISPIDF